MRIFFFTFFSLNQETTLIVVEKLGNIREFYCEIVLIAIKLFFFKSSNLK